MGLQSVSIAKDPPGQRATHIPERILPGFKVAGTATGYIERSITEHRGLYLEPAVQHDLLGAHPR